MALEMVLRDQVAAQAHVTLDTHVPDPISTHLLGRLYCRECAQPWRSLLRPWRTGCTAAREARLYMDTHPHRPAADSPTTPGGWTSTPVPSVAVASPRAAGAGRTRSAARRPRPHPAAVGSAKVVPT